jgi:propanol-preferring alcohol dehydrogenase
MTDIPSFPYEKLWHERTLRSVANMTRRDADEFMELCAAAGVRADVEVFPLSDANTVLRQLKEDGVRGAAVLTME